MLEIILVVDESFARIEWWVDVDQLNFANVSIGEFGHAGEGFKDVARFAKDEEVVLLRGKVCALGVFEPVTLG